jgi:hypothetical protein
MDAARCDLIPPAAVIRKRLAWNVRERTLLRGLLKLSVQASRDDLRDVAGAPDMSRESTHPTPCGAAH